MTEQYFINQRVLINNRVIGHVVTSEQRPGTLPEDQIWVFNPEKGYASCYSKSSIKPLPGGQL